MGIDAEDPRVMAGATAPPSPGAPGSEPARLARELRRLVLDHIELATLEARLSIDILSRMLILTVAVALLLVSAWLALLGSGVLALIAAGLPPVVAMLLCAVLNLALALWGWGRLRDMSGGLGWPATLRALNPGQGDTATRGSGGAQA